MFEVVVRDLRSIYKYDTHITDVLVCMYMNMIIVCMCRNIIMCMCMNMCICECV